MPSRVGGAVLKALGAVFAIFFDVLGFVIGVLALSSLAFLRGPVRAGLAAIGRFLRHASRMVTPARALTVVVAGAAVLLALSQFADYRSVSVGTDAYAEVETVAPAPEKERDETGSAHAYLMVPLAVGRAGACSAPPSMRPALAALPGDRRGGVVGDRSSACSSTARRASTRATSSSPSTASRRRCSAASTRSSSPALLLDRVGAAARPRAAAGRDAARPPQAPQRSPPPPAPPARRRPRERAREALPPRRDHPAA